MAGAIIQGTQTANATSATAIVTASTPILWVVLLNQGSANVYFGGSALTSAAPDMTPRGETPVLKVDDLNKVFIQSASGSQTVAYVAGRKGAYS